MRHKLPMFYGAQMELFKFAERMRLAPTEGEKTMWDLLKSEFVSLHKFRRQHPIATFIADFYSHKLKLVIEIDGGYHLNLDQKEYDDFRDEDMAALGISVIRFTNDDIINRQNIVKSKLINKIERQQKSILNKVDK